MDSSGAISSWAGGGATTTLGAAQTAYGLYLDSKNKRPEYNIPDEVYKNLNQATQLALQGIPESQKMDYINNIMRSGAYGLNQLSSRSGGLQGITALNQNQNDAFLKMAAMDANARLANMKDLYNIRQNIADYKDKAWQFNKQNPYYENVAKSQALIGAGMQNVSQGLQAGNTGNVDWGGNKKPQQQTQQPQYYDYNNYYSPYKSGNQQLFIVPKDNFEMDLDMD